MIFSWIGFKMIILEPVKKFKNTIFYSRSLTEALVDFGSICTIVQIGRNHINRQRRHSIIVHFGIGSGWFIQSNALERSVRRAPNS